MFEIGWSELLLIAVVALIAIGPKELPGVLRTVGQWIGKARRMAADFQGQFNEAMREAEMAELKTSFDEVREATRGLSGGQLMNRLADSLGEPPKLEELDKPATDRPAADRPAASGSPASAGGSVPPELAISQQASGGDDTALASGPSTSEPSVSGPSASAPLAITREFQDGAPAEAVKDASVRDVKAS